MCNCGCLNSVDCTCPTYTGVANAIAVNYITNLYTPAEDITGAGYNVVLYTNTSGSAENVFVETNMYITGTEITSVTTSTYLIDATPQSGNGVATREGTPTKVDHTHQLSPLTLANGEVISITVVGSLGTAKLKWLKSIVYKY